MSHQSPGITPNSLSTQSPTDDTSYLLLSPCFSLSPSKPPPSLAWTTVAQLISYTPTSSPSLCSPPAAQESLRTEIWSHHSPAQASCDLCLRSPRLCPSPLPSGLWQNELSTVYSCWKPLGRLDPCCEPPPALQLPLPAASLTPRHVSLVCSLSTLGGLITTVTLEVLKPLSGGGPAIIFFELLW